MSTREKELEASIKARRERAAQDVELVASLTKIFGVLFFVVWIVLGIRVFG